MPLNRSLLKKIKHRGKKVTAQCPACAEASHDKKGEHLVIFPDGRFGCVAHPGDRTHRRRIAQLIGEKTGARRPWKLRLPAQPTSRSGDGVGKPISALAREKLKKTTITRKQPSGASEPSNTPDVPDVPLWHTHYASQTVHLYADAAARSSGASETISAANAAKQPSGPSGITKDVITLFDGKARHFPPGAMLPPSLAEVVRGWRHCPATAVLPPQRPRVIGWSKKGRPIYEDGVSHQSSGHWADMTTAQKDAWARRFVRTDSKTTPDAVSRPASTFKPHPLMVSWAARKAAGLVDGARPRRKRKRTDGD